MGNVDLSNIKLGIIGGGQMAEAIVKGLLSKKALLPEQIFVSDITSDRLEYLKKNYEVNTTDDNLIVAAHCNTIILAVKPQVIDKVLEGLCCKITIKHLVMSIAAGIPISRLEAGLDQNCRVIRIMPNTPALVQQAASALAKGSYATDQDLELALTIFSQIGKAVVVPESMLDAVTGLSGSGPAYCFSFIDALIDAGVREGLPRNTARDLAIQTVIGSAVLASSSQKNPAALKEMVTSPGGTTIEGLFHMELAGFKGIIMDAVRAATARSKELGKAKD